jgi:hypothetical protein
VALWRANPTIRTVARDLSRAGGDSDGQALGEVVQSYGRGDCQADLQGPRTRAPCLSFQVLGVLDGERIGRAAGHRWVRGPVGPHPAFERGQSRRACGEPGAEQRHETERFAYALPALLEGLDRLLDDAQGVLEDVREQKGEHPDREHRDCHPPTVAHDLEPPQREPEKDGEAGQSTKDNRFRERHPNPL